MRKLHYHSFFRRYIKTNTRKHTWFCAIKKVWVVGTLAKLHQDVEQSHLVTLASSIDNINVLHQDLGVPLSLHLAQANVDLGLLLRQ